MASHSEWAGEEVRSSSTGRRANERPDERPNVQPDVQPDVRQNVRLNVRSEVRSNVRSNVRSHVRQDVRSDVRPDLPPDIQLFICSLSLSLFSLRQQRRTAGGALLTASGVLSGMITAADAS